MYQSQKVSSRKTGNIRNRGITFSIKSKRPKFDRANEVSNPRKLDPASLQGKFFISKIPKIPELSPECQSYVDSLRKENCVVERNCIRIPKSKSTKGSAKDRRTKLNGFMAYRSFYSKNVPSQHQSALSLVLSQEWAKDYNVQKVWKRYAIEFNSRTAGARGIEDGDFITWLLHTTSEDGTQLETEKISRIENVFLKNPQYITQEQNTIETTPRHLHL